MTLRIGTQLVGVRADSPATLRTLRTLLAGWVDDDHPDVPWALDLRLEPTSGPTTGPTTGPGSGSPGSANGTHSAGRGPRSVPQLRRGQLLMARSRDPDDILRALATVLGGVLARQDEARIWSGLRAFAGAERIVLVEAQPPTLAADRSLALAGVEELPTWSVVIDGSSVLVPPPLTGLDWEAVGVVPPAMAWRTAALGGIVALDDEPDERRDHEHNADHDAGHDAGHDTGHETGAALLSRFGVRHHSAAWFSTVEQLVRAGQVMVTSDRSALRRRLIELASTDR